MTLTPSTGDRKQLEDITAAWEEYDRSGNPEVIADYLSADMMFLPPGESPVEGKEAVLEYLGDPDPEAEYNPDLDQWPENIYVSGDLAVVHVCVATPPDDADESGGGGVTGLDVYRRGEDGEWGQIISIWNDGI